MSVASDSGKQYYLECTGLALDTVKKHSAKEDITLFGSCFCPFVQRVWVSFEFLGIPYQYYEVDPYKKPRDLLKVSPKGLVPGLKLNTYDPPRALNESTVIMEYLEDLAARTTSSTLLPPLTDPYARALVRLQADHVNRALVPAFYRFLQAQDAATQIETSKKLHATLEELVSLLERADRETEAGSGLWKKGGTLNWTDVMAGPWLFRATNVLKHYRAFDLPVEPRFAAWLHRIFEHPAFKSTCSTEQLYLDSYERYAYNRPNTSQVANAINSGQPLP